MDLTARQTERAQPPTLPPPPPQPPPPAPPPQVISPPEPTGQQRQPQPQDQPIPDVFVPPLSDGDDPMTRGDKRGVQPESQKGTRRSERMRGRFEKNPNHPLAHPVDTPHKTKSKTKPKRARSFAQYSDSSEDEMTERQQKRLQQDVASQEQPSPQTSQSAPVTQQPSPQPGPSRQRVGMATRTKPYYRARQQLPPDTPVHTEPSSMNCIKVQLQRGSDIPQRQTKQAGLDVHSKKKVVLAPKSVNRIDINLKVAVPDRYLNQEVDWPARASS